MKTADSISVISDAVKAGLREALEDLVTGVRRADSMKAACERMDRMREHNRALFGVQEIAVDLIREARDS